jgi:hypothetical protein
MAVEGMIVPAYPRVGKLQILLRPQWNATNEPITDAAATIWLGRDGAWELRSPALSQPADRGTYYSSIEIDDPGDWRARVVVASGDDVGVVDVDLRVRSRARSGAGLWGPTLVYLGASVLIVAGVLWIVFSAKRARSHVT